MAHGLSCDRCGKSLLIDEDVRYVARLEVVAAYDPMEVTEEDLAADREGEMGRLLEKMAGLTEQEALESVYWRRVYDLCPPCQASYVKDPFRGRGAGL